MGKRDGGNRVTKQELSRLLHRLNMPVNEGVTSPENFNRLPRIVYWEYLWEDRTSSGTDYDTVTTYQISFYADRPSHSKLLELREYLREAGLHPIISHEYSIEDKIWHSYFAVEVTENE